MSDLMTELDALLQQRRIDSPEGSYSAGLLQDPVLAQRKIMEEAFEVCLELGGTPVDAGRVAAEAADLVFHLLAGLAGAGVRWNDVLEQLASRRGTRR